MDGSCNLRLESQPEELTAAADSSTDEVRMLIHVIMYARTVFLLALTRWDGTRNQPKRPLSSGLRTTGDPAVDCHILVDNSALSPIHLIERTPAASRSSAS
jgi:hypothetical protein